MLKRTPPEALQEDQESSFRRLIRTFDPDVPGYVFWPIIFGVGGDLRASGAPRLLAARGGLGSRR
jgi:hypothetical protein